MHQATGHGVKFRQIDLIAEGRGILACGVVIRIEPLRPQCFGQLRQVERRLLAAVQAPEFGGGRVEAAEQELIRGVVIVQVVVLQQENAGFTAFAAAAVSFMKSAKDSIRNL